MYLFSHLESAAFHVPCITTDLAGFGLWVNGLKGKGYSEIADGVKVMHRTDYNFNEVADMAADTIFEYSKMSDAEVKAARRKAGAIAEKALWKHFIENYYDAYDFAIRKAEARLSENKK